MQRNPDILLYGLPWAFPGWIGNGTRDPYHNPALTADYIVKWIEGAKQVHNLTIDFVGVCFFLPLISYNNFFKFRKVELMAEFYDNL